MNVRIDSSWHRKLAEEFTKPYFVELAAYVRQEYASETVYPPPRDVFRAFDLCPFEKTKVVILGQDPYHGRGQANGLSFAVGENVPPPPSLRNIFMEITNDFGKPLVHRGGDLARLASQGVLLLNATLTVRARIAGSHQHKGWETFTEAAIRALSEEREHLVFMLWGNHAKARGTSIDHAKHLVLEAPHPSPFSASSGFFGCKHFSKANAYLLEHGEVPIDWL